MIKRVNMNGSVYYERDGVGLYPTLRNLILSKVKDFNFYECLDVIEYIKIEISKRKTLQLKLSSFALFEMLFYGSKLCNDEESFLSKAVTKAKNEMATEIADYILSSTIGR